MDYDIPIKTENAAIDFDPGASREPAEKPISPMAAALADWLLDACWVDHLSETRQSLGEDLTEWLYAYSESR